MKPARIALLIATVCLFTNIARAQTCQAMFDDLETYARQPVKPGEKRWVDFQLVINTPDMKWSQYTAGMLTYMKEGSVYPESLTGIGKQYFSDRVWSATDFPSTEGNPFNPAKTDRLEVTIEPGYSPGAPKLTKVDLRVRFRLLTWGDRFSDSVPQCAKGFMYGFIGDQMYIFSFKKGGSHLD